MTRLVLALMLLALPATQLPPRPPVLGLAHVRLTCGDLSAARRFYGELLGLPELSTPASADSATFIVNDRQRIIVQPGSTPEHDDRFVDVAWETSDVVAMRRYLEARRLSVADLAATNDARGVQTTDADGHRILLVEPGNTAAANTTDRRISRRILHAGLTVRDAEAADRFYKDSLGFSEIWRGGRPEGTTSWINMRVPEGTDYLEYMLTPTPPDRRQLGTAHHIALLVTDIQAALETVRARTTDTDPNHRAVPQIGVNRRWQLNVYDPDGTRVEFMEPWTVR